MLKATPLQNELLEQLRSMDVVRREGVELTSGERADYYIDIKKAFGAPQTLLLMAQCLAAMVPDTATVVAGGGYGGIPLATAVAQQAGLRLALVRDGHRDHGLQKKIEGYVPSADDSVIIVDDVVTTGESCRTAAESIGDRGAALVGWCAVVWRGEGGPPPELAFLFTAEELLS